MQKEPPHLTQVQRLFYIDSRFRTLRGRFRQLRTALRRRGCGDPPSGGGGPHGRSPCMAFLPPSGGVFRLSHLGVIAGYPMQTVMRFSRFVAGFGNKKSPHNNLNLTIPSGMALVRVRYVAIRKLKTCSGSFGSRAGTLSKYVILNCWDRLPQKSSHVNVNLSGRGPSILLRKTVLSLKSPTGAFIAPLHCANANF